MADTQAPPRLRLTPDELAIALSDYAARCERKAQAITATASTMQKPAELRIKRELEATARAFTYMASECNGAVRQLKHARLEPTDA